VLTVLTVPLSMHAMAKKDNAWDQHTTEVTTDLGNGDKTYTSIYPVNVAKGLVTVKFSKSYDIPLEQIEPKDVHIVVKRHDVQKIIVAAKLTKDIVARCDKAENDKDYKQYNWVWTPWYDDSIKKQEYLFQAIAAAKLRGGNRLSVIIGEPGYYEITIPSDADAKIKTVIGNIDYRSIAPTKLHIDATSVNHWGDNGCSEPGHESWDYFRGDQFAPKTELKTKKGHINVP